MYTYVYMTCQWVQLPHAHSSACPTLQENIALRKTVGRWQEKRRRSLIATGLYKMQGLSTAVLSQSGTLRGPPNFDNTGSSKIIRLCPLAFLLPFWALPGVEKLKAPPVESPD